MGTIQDLRKAYGDMFDIVDEAEEDREEKIKMYSPTSLLYLTNLLTSNSLKARGKGAPKKKRTAEGMRGGQILKSGC